VRVAAGQKAERYRGHLAVAPSPVQADEQIGATLK